MPDGSKPDKMPIILPLYRNMQGPEVKKLQMWLNDLNDYYQFNPKERLNESGFFGDQTIRMVKAFQKFWDLPPSGMYDARTHDILEYKFWNMNNNLAIAMQRAQRESAFSERKW
jgi:peptidoglycan hydrolase-like protein with peptidoglycan-binding domain